MKEKLLVTQSLDIVTVGHREVPVLVRASIGRYEYVAAMAVNFIRSDSPRVQVILETTISLLPQIEELKKALNQIGDFLVVPRDGMVVEIVPRRNKE